MRMEANLLKISDELERMANLALYIRKCQDYNKHTGIYTIQKPSDLIDVSKIEADIFNESILDPDVFDRLHKIQQNLEQFQKRKEVEANGK